MPERREGIDPQRAAELEEILERQFKTSGLGKGDVYRDLSAVQIIDYAVTTFGTLDQALDVYCDRRAIDPEMRVQIALICGELFGVGDLSDIKGRLELSENTKSDLGPDVIRVGKSPKWVDVKPSTSKE